MALYGMVIDLNKCNHCESCITACKVENNLQIVSKENADMERVMQWMRLATSFYEGNYPDVRPVTMPALCLQCDDPPCTKVCPVTVSYTHLRAHETVLDLVCRLLLEKKK